MPAVKSHPELRKVPLRALLALAARCARRVQMHFALPHGPVAEAAAQEAIDRALRLVEDVAAGIEIPDDDVSVAESNLFAVVIAVSQTEPVNDKAAYAANAAHAAINATRFAVDALRGLCPADQVVEAVAIGRDAACAADDRVAERAAADLAALQRSKLGSFPDAGAPIDASERALLGPLFEEGAAIVATSIHDRVMFADRAVPEPPGERSGNSTTGAMEARSPATEPAGAAAEPARDRPRREAAKDKRRRARLQVERERLARDVAACRAEQRQLALEREKLARFAEEACREAAALREAQAQLQAESDRLSAERAEFEQQCQEFCAARDDLEDAQRQLDEERSKLESDRARFTAELARLGTFLSGLIAGGGQD